MINIEVRLHDKYSVEFKSGISISNKNSKEEMSEFMINTWIFVPSSLDINRGTYHKKEFYKDVKTNLRLITPIYSLREILTEGRGPFPRLQRAIDSLQNNPESESLTDHYSYQIKMLMCIIKSALRREANDICTSEQPPQIPDAVEELVKNIRCIKEQYRALKNQLNNESITAEQKQVFLFGDEFLGNIIEQHSFEIMRRLKKSSVFTTIKPTLYQLIQEEVEYKKTKGFMTLNGRDADRNSMVILQRNILKKFVESDLFLHVNFKKDGAIAKQVYYGIAAAVAMIFATVISFIATQRYGNFTTDLFIILVVSYVFKDRIKDVMRYYFTSSMSKKYFDNKLKLSIRNREIGFIKESFDFVEEEKLPSEIRSLRNRAPLVEAENKVYGENIIRYRKWVSLSPKEIEKYKEYHLSGINDITRFNLMQYIQKMDDPTIPLYDLNEFEGYETFEGVKVYSLYFILNCVSETNEYYKKYRILFNRTGITDIKELK